MVLITNDDILERINEENENMGELVDMLKLKNMHKDQNDSILSLIHFNIRSLKKNIDNLLLFIETYNLNYIDVIVLSETFQIDSTKNCSIPGYQLFYNEANYNRNDGMLILAKNHINVEFTFTKLPNSGATLSRLNFNINNITFGLTATYKPPPISKADFITDIHDYMESLTYHNLELFVGDVNIDILEINDNNVANYLSTMSTLGFQPYINKITRPISGTCLDHIFVNKKLQCSKINLNSYILEGDITDHSPVMLTIRQQDVSLKLVNNQEIPRNKLNIVKFKKLLKDTKWRIVTEEKNPESATNIFLNKYKELITKATDSYTITNRHKKIKSWITSGIITSIKVRDKMKKKLTKNYNPVLELEYKKYRNYLSKLIHKQKNDYYRAQIENNKGDIKKLYTIIKDATYETNTNKQTLLDIKNEDGENFDNFFEMANFCNNYFVNIGTKMEQAIPPPNEEHKTDNPIVKSIFLNPITKNELIKHISSLKNNSAPGWDGISVYAIKQTLLEIIDPLLHIYNIILETGIIPSEFKIAIVAPIHKSGSKTLINNYRPISLITNFAKIFEKCIKERLLNFFKKNKVLSTNQYGFLEKCSTSDAMHALVSEVVKNLNANKKCVTVFLDLAKAFDTVPHLGLISVLQNYGIRGVSLQLLESYLSERSQRVKINNTFSNDQKIKIGIPQGTVLGPILFIIYINSLLNLQNDGLTISYADDTAVVISDDSWEQVKNKTINSLSKIMDWLKTHKLTLNLNKTNYIAFSLTNANRPSFDEISVDGQHIKEVASTKYLGIVIDKFLKWQPHIDYISDKIRKLIYKFYLLREFINSKTLLTIYKAFVESIVRYGILVWGGLYNNSLYKLNIIQKYILKIIYRRNRLYPSHLLFNNDILDVRSLYLLTICSYIHTHLGTQQQVDHYYNTRNNCNRHIKLPISHNNLNLRYVNYFGPKIYNQLPREVTSKINMKLFKSLVRGVICEKRYQFGRLFS